MDIAWKGFVRWINRVHGEVGIEVATEGVYGIHVAFIELFSEADRADLDEGVRIVCARGTGQLHVERWTAEEMQAYARLVVDNAFDPLFEPCHAPPIGGDDDPA